MPANFYHTFENLSLSLPSTQALPLFNCWGSTKTTVLQPLTSPKRRSFIIEIESALETVEGSFFFDLYWNKDQ